MKVKNVDLLRENPVSINKEIAVLYELGLEQYDIEYIVYLKYKEVLAEKWEH